MGYQRKDLSKKVLKKIKPSAGSVCISRTYQGKNSIDPVIGNIAGKSFRYMWAVVWWQTTEKKIAVGNVVGSCRYPRFSVGNIWPAWSGRQSANHQYVVGNIVLTTGCRQCWLSVFHWNFVVFCCCCGLFIFPNIVFVVFFYVGCFFLWVQLQPSAFFVSLDNALDKVRIMKDYYKRKIVWMFCNEIIMCNELYLSNIERSILVWLLGWIGLFAPCPWWLWLFQATEY